MDDDLWSIQYSVGDFDEVNRIMSLFYEKFTQHIEDNPNWYNESWTKKLLDNMD